MFRPRPGGGFFSAWSGGAECNIRGVTATHHIQANTNGRLHSASEPTITPLNRGFLYGDAIYEVWRTYGGVVFTWREHYDRLERSAAALELELPWSREELWTQIARTAAAFRTASGFAGELYIRLQVSRGGGPIGLDPALADRAEFVILVQPCPLPAPEIRRRGVRLATSNLRRNPIDCLSPAWKTGNYLNNILGMREARRLGADDVLMLNLQGEITESSTSNVGFVRDGVILTPPMSAGILGGITRSLLLREVAPAAGFEVREVTLRPTDLPGMQEAFVLSTTKDVLPVCAIDEVAFRVEPDGVVSRLHVAMEGYGHREAADHPELRV